MPVTVNKLDYIYKKLLNEVKSKMNDTVEINDEEYVNIYEGNDSGNQGGNDEPIEQTPGEYTEEWLNTFELDYEFYEDENNDIILNIKNFDINNELNYDEFHRRKYNLKLCKTENPTSSSDCFNKVINYGKNDITDIINQCKIYPNSYDQQYYFCICIVKSSFYTPLYTKVILFKLDYFSHDLSYYQIQHISSPKFIFDIDTNTIELIQNASIKYKDTIYECNNINEYSINIKSKQTDAHLSFESYKNNKINVNYINQTKLSLIENIPSGRYLILNINGSHLYYKDMHWSSVASLQLKDDYKAGSDYKPPINLLLNIEPQNIINTYNIEISNKFSELDLDTGWSIKTVKFLNDDFIDLLCQELNYQRSALKWYTNWQFLYYEYNSHINNNNSINIRKNINNIANNFNPSNGYIRFDGTYEQQILTSLEPFKVYITANDNDYILINVTWYYEN